MTYSELKTSIADFLNRQDLTAVIPTFISLAEADFNRSIRHRSMLGRSTASLDTQFTELPYDFLEAKNVQINTDPVRSLEFVSIEQADLLRPQYDGEPRFYTIVGETLESVPSPQVPVTIELTYYKRLTPLSDSQQTNWLLTNSPDVYLYGALLQSAPYLKDDERVAVWGSLYSAAKNDLNFSSDKSEFSGSTLRMRVRA